MRKRDELKERLLREKAIEMIVEAGFDGLSMPKLAKSARISPATIYIYFKDREDLILQLCYEEGKKMAEATLANFDAAMPFAEGLKIQWLNRAKYCLENPLSAQFLEQVKYSPFYDRSYFQKDNTFSSVMREFVHGAIARKELIPLPIEIYWSVAFAPLYQLIKFHTSGKGLPGTGNFKLDDRSLLRTLELVLKALKP